jgi:hypothetical protein
VGEKAKRKEREEEGPSELDLLIEKMKGGFKE